jgi:hypothetical protein
MRELIVNTFLTLDGVMQAPGGPEEDPSGGFEHGGWSFGYWDEQMQGAMGELMSKPFDLVLGRKTYEILSGAGGGGGHAGAELDLSSRQPEVSIGTNFPTRRVSASRTASGYPELRSSEASRSTSYSTRTISGFPASTSRYDARGSPSKGEPTLPLLATTSSPTRRI